MNTKTANSQQKTQKLVFAGLFSAIAFVLYLLEFPVVPGVDHLKLDLSDVPALVGAVFFGPGFGVIVELIKNLIEMLVKGIGTQMGFGNIMNFLVGCAYVIPFSLIYRKLSDKANAKELRNIIISAVAGIACIILVGIGGNYLIAPLFFKYFLGIELSSTALWGAIWGATALNAIKGTMLSVVIYPLMMFFTKKMGNIFKLPKAEAKKEIKNEEKENSDDTEKVLKQS